MLSVVTVAGAALWALSVPGATARLVAVAPTTTPPTTTAPTTTSTTTSAAPTTTVDPGTLAQTRDRPSAGDPAFEARMDTLWVAVVTGDPAPAASAFFPRSAYLQVKAVKDPGADWQNRLVALFDHDLVALHAALGPDPSAATLVGVDVPAASAVWVPPGAEVNKIGYWRVYGTRIRYRVNGHDASFVIQSLISWRGQWFVVHLTTPPR